VETLYISECSLEIAEVPKDKEEDDDAVHRPQVYQFTDYCLLAASSIIIQLRLRKGRSRLVIIYKALIGLI